MDEAQEAFAEHHWRRLIVVVADALKLDPENRDARGFLDAASKALVDDSLARGGEVSGKQARGGSDSERASLQERLQILNEMMRIAVASHEVADAFDLIGELVRRIIDFDRLSIVINLPGSDYTDIYAVAGDDPPAMARSRISRDDAFLADVVRAGRPLVRKDLVKDAVYASERRIARETNLRSTMFVPLKARRRVIGTLNFGSNQRARYGEREVYLAEQIANHPAVVVEHTFLHERLKTAGRLEERNRLAREIHDTLAQSLTGIALRLESAEKELRDEPDAARADIRAARLQALKSLEDARRSLWDLQPESLDGGDLPSALGHEAARFAKEGLEISVHIEGTAPLRIDERAESALLRIAQESLNNIKPTRPRQRCEGAT